MATERREKLGINLHELDRMDEATRVRLLKGRLDLINFVVTKFDRIEGEDEHAVVFTCDLLEAAIICDVIRNNDRKAGDFPTRLYLKRGKWSRIPSHVVLTVVAGGKPVLNPKVFPVEEKFVPLAPKLGRID